jgi:hypothetical protein
MVAGADCSLAARIRELGASTDRQCNCSSTSLRDRRRDVSRAESRYGAIRMQPGSAVGCIGYLATAWRQPNEGVWEVRGGRQHFVHSKVMAWAAFDRAANELEAQAFHESGGDGARSPTKSMPRSVSVVSTPLRRYPAEPLDRPHT